jgi:hypothetical protein
MRRAPGLVAAMALSLLVVAGCSGASEPDETGGVDPAGLGLPESSVGRATAEALAALGEGALDAATYERLFAVSFRDQVSLAQLNALAGVEIDVSELRAGQAPNYLTAAADVAGLGPGILTSGVDAGGRLVQFAVAGEPPRPQPVAEGLGSWRALDRRLTRLAPTTTLYVAEVVGEECEPVHAARGGQAVPLGSAYKLYVLDALAAAVAEGRVAWDDTVTIDDDVRTLPSGVLQATSGEVVLSVHDAAALMVSISDNTAADALLALVGRDDVEAQARSRGVDAATFVPFLSAAELFWLRLVDWPDRAEAYVRADEEQRRELLGESVTEPRPEQAEVVAWDAPRWSDGPGWQASGATLCRVLAGLHERSQDDALLAETLTLNDAGLALDRETWPRTMFKGGSEIGVAALAHLAERADGSTYAVVVTAADPREELPPETAGELLEVTRAAYALLAEE